MSTERRQSENNANNFGQNVKHVQNVRLLLVDTPPIEKWALCAILSNLGSNVIRVGAML